MNRFTPGANKALDLALREALQLGHNYVGTEHLLLALMHEDGNAARVMRLYGMDLDELRRDVLKLTNRTRAPEPAEPAQPETSDPVFDLVDTLQKVGEMILSATAAALLAPNKKGKAG